MTLTILMPCLNEAKTVGPCVAEALGFLSRSGVKGEVLVVDNGSADGSPALAQAAGARVVTEARRGYGAALMRGFREARGRFIVYGDCDGSYDFSDLTPFLAAFEQGAALVAGDRFAGGISPGAMPPSHRLGVPALSALARLRFGVGVRDFHCGLRGVRRDTALSLGLRCPGMEFATEIIAACARRGLPIMQVRVPLRPDGRAGPSHLRTLRDGLRHLRFICFPKLNRDNANLKGA
ncbi:MAG: glycosyltransferase family 2 protein [Eubacteriales bacterium]|nr:glycosyltransferase family 2 protein [Eubacteriales bacterium]